MGYNSAKKRWGTVMKDMLISLFVLAVILLSICFCKAANTRQHQIIEMLNKKSLG